MGVKAVSLAAQQRPPERPAMDGLADICSGTIVGMTYLQVDSVNIVVEINLDLQGDRHGWRKCRRIVGNNLDLLSHGGEARPGRSEYLELCQG